MTPEIMNLMFPESLPLVDEVEAKYPPRSLPDGAQVTRVAPSPTGYLHIGTVYAGLLAERVAHQSGGVFYVRLEDTDQKRKVDGADELIRIGFDRFGIRVDEGKGVDGHDVGAYAPYTQSERRDIYMAYAKLLVEKGLAYPCFCSEEDLDLMRKVQEKQKLRPGYYGKYAKCRTMTDEQVLEKLHAGQPWVLRFKSCGKPENRIVINDMLKGNISMPENDMDIVLIKGDGLPTYHLAHIVDDHLMRTTLASRGDEWLSSTPLHMQMFEAFEWNAPRYAHLAPLQKLEDGNRRKISKRKDPEANVAYFGEQGYPKEAIIDYLMNLINANFEEWRKQNPEASAFDFPMNFDKVSNTAGALFDFQKVDSISKEVIAKMTATQVFDAILAWANEYDTGLAKRLSDNRDYVTEILNVERLIGPKSRKDLIRWSQMSDDLVYFFDDMMTLTQDEKMDMLKPFSHMEISNLAQAFSGLYDANDDKDAWFGKIKQVAESQGFAIDMKAYKANPAAYTGSVADAAKILRVLITGRDKTPDLYAIMKILGADRVKGRLDV